MQRLLIFGLSAFLTYTFASKVGPEVKRLYEKIDERVEFIVDQTERLR